MLRGIYTAATGMIMNHYKMDVIANNLANVDKTAFKAEDAIFKSFPEMLIRRTRDDGLGWVPIGSFDLAPIVGKLGTGVELNEVFIRFEKGALKKTDNHFDLAIDDKSMESPAFFVVLTDRGEKLTRSGNFTLDKDGFLVTHDGFPLLGEKGPIRVSRWNWIVKENGEIWINRKYGNDPLIGTNETQNQWEEPVLLDRIKIRTVEFPRELKKEGNSFYSITPESGPMLEFKEEFFPKILQGYLEASNVNIVREMTKMIEVQREYEANQKSITTHDNLLGKLINEVAR
ncbi:MAG: flagellar hook-basal body protein [Leptospiraceae bacterium]|nr:flagellar hook-basal body protein [Leptospiraceae bacterium]MDW7975682.1 flagellar hook-basal body protein [Leptospiraceae bacterium]